MKLTLVTDTWNNVNGVATTLKATVAELRSRGYTIQIIEPDQFRTISAPRYPEVKLSWNLWKVGRLIRSFDPDFIHIATEGPLGIAARWYCKVRHRNIPHNTSYHTKFPEYLNIHYGLPISVGYYFMRIFHKFSHRVLVTTPTMKKTLENKGFKNLTIWSRGVDHAIFNPDAGSNEKRNGPVLLCVSRVSREKGLDDFCSIKTTGTKILVGNGPYLDELRKKYPDVIYTGYKRGTDLAQYYANADVVVFPSKSDTFGVVMLESIACGTPVAAYPVTGPIDVIEHGVNGAMNDNLMAAIDICLGLDRKTVEKSSYRFTWKSCTDVFEKNLISVHGNG